jgi:hypothetical protein
VVGGCGLVSPASFHLSAAGEEEEEVGEIEVVAVPTAAAAAEVVGVAVVSEAPPLNRSNSVGDLSEEEAIRGGVSAEAEGVGVNGEGECSFPGKRRDAGAAGVPAEVVEPAEAGIAEAIVVVLAAVVLVVVAGVVVVKLGVDITEEG